MALAEMKAANGDFDNAKQQLTLAFAKAEQLGGPGCPASMEAKARLARIAQQASDFSDLLALAEGEAKASKPAQAVMGQFVVGMDIPRKRFRPTRSWSPITPVPLRRPGPERGSQL